MNTKIESVTLATTTNLTGLLTSLDFADQAELTRFNETEKAENFLKLLRQQYSSLQHGSVKGKPAAGELPNAIYIPVIKGLYDTKAANAIENGVEFAMKYENFRDAQIKQLKFYIETGELFNRKKETLQEKAMVAIDKLEKKLKAEQAKLDKAKADAEKAKAKANDIINNNKTKIKEAAELKVDLIVAAPTPEIKEILDYADTVIESAKKEAVKAHNDAADAADDANDAILQVTKTAVQLQKAKEKLEKLSAPKVEVKPDLSSVEFSKDCRAEMTEVLNELTKDYSDVELLCLASLIRKRLVPSKV